MAAVTNPRRAYWLKTLHQWHWISAGVCLVGMLLFSLTGVTLNHATQIGAEPKVTTRRLELPAPLLSTLKTAQTETLPDELRHWLGTQLALTVGRDIERSPDEIYITLPRPGGDAWLRIDLADGAVEYENTDRGWIAYLNDLHKGRHTGAAWRWFIDAFALACLVFCVTGLFILKLHAANRPTTWPLVGAGLVIPLLLIILFIH